MEAMMDDNHYGWETDVPEPPPDWMVAALVLILAAVILITTRWQ